MTDWLRSLSGIRVLVVDDHEDTRDLSEELLVHAGASVVTASSAREALTAFDYVDIVVTDYSMPDETGLWLLERICEHPRPRPVIMLTGYAEVHVEQLRKAPFARVLREPIARWQLCDAVAAVVRGDKPRSPIDESAW